MLEPCSASNRRASRVVSDGREQLPKNTEVLQSVATILTGIKQIALYFLAAARLRRLLKNGRGTARTMG